MVESRCELKCSEYEYKEQMGCHGCFYMENPFWGKCAIKESCESKKYEHCGMCEGFPCDQLTAFAYDEKQGDNGQRIKQCLAWKGEN